MGESNTGLVQIGLDWIKQESRFQDGREMQELPHILVVCSLVSHLLSWVAETCR